MNPINKKPAEKTENIFYGVDVNDKEAVMKEYKRLKQRHRFLTFVAVIALLVLGGIFVDFVRVNTLGGKPIVAVSKSVENGTLFTGIGYKVLYCDDGTRYVGAVLYESCSIPEELTFEKSVYNMLMSYGEKRNVININNLANLEITNIEYDEDNSEGGKDYLLDITFSCKDGKNKCFKLDKEFNDAFNVKVYIRINRYNEIYELLTFKNSGNYYNLINNDYKEKVKAYLIENGLFDEENVRSYVFKLDKNNGKYKFRGINYADSYLASINYLCYDETDNCINAFDKKDYEGDYANLLFYLSVLIDDENNVKLVGPREYLDMD